ncbi:MAG: hypothetical protein H6738_01830 [Alphaproteobacteria bacterium]|nr:hypothetical protein [Alphaproteobacteria bacterium]MCB9695508.1 hypothetical protein [Alphaproteobacteria bacterium]
MGPRGCLSLLVPVRSAPTTRALPLLSEAEVHPKDRAALRRARTAAEGALASIRGAGAPDIAVDDLTTKLGALLGGLQRLAEDLGRARRFLEQNDPDRLARQKADLEMRRLTASASEIVPMRAEAKALEERELLAGRVRSELVALEARLAAAGQELEAFRARVQARTAIDELGHEVDAYQRAAEAAFEAFRATRAELG